MKYIQTHTARFTARILLSTLIISFLWMSCTTSFERETGERLKTELERNSIVAATNHGEVEYALMGDGPVVLILHGSMGGYDFGAAISGLVTKHGFSVLTISRPGYLRTPIETGAKTADQADAIAALLNVLDIRNVTVAGGSAGGPVALQFATRFPDRCRALILQSAVIEQRDRSQFSLLQRIMMPFMFRDQPVLDLVALAEQSPEKAVRKAFPDDADEILSDPKQVELALAVLRTSYPMSTRRVGTYNDLKRTQSFPFDRLTDISVPTLIIHGSEDEWVPVEDAVHAAEEIQTSELVILEGAKHLMFLTHLEAYERAISSFLIRHASDGPTVEESRQ